MDVKSLVDKKMIGEDRCISCFLSTVVFKDGNSTRVVALVEADREHALFLYQLSQIPTSNPAHLQLSQDAAIPITTNFKFTIEQAQATQGVIPVRVVDETRNLILEISKTENTGHFLTELKRACEAQSQVKGLPPSFGWLDKYLNPFLNDIFDPLSQSNTNWAWEDLLQQDKVGDRCPVVLTEGEVDRSPSLQGLDDLTDGMTSKGSSTFLPVSKMGHMQRSYEKSLDDLGDTIKGGKPVGGRENLIKLIMRSKEEEYVEQMKLRVFCGTWNVNGQAASERLEEWLSCDAEPPDIYAIGFQELDLSKNAFIFAESSREEEWYRRVKDGLHRGANYKRIKLVRLVGMMLIVFVREEHADHIYDVSSDMVGTGILGMMGNKGGVGVRFEIHDTSICFVNSHLAAHVEEYEHRNQDFRNINSRMNFSTKIPALTISDHDQVFWIGDLNYRLSDIDNDKVKLLIENNNLQPLMNHDQLCRQMALKKVFLDYLEGRINFIPTYKYDPGSDEWDTSEKCRTPAWCDRVLWRGSNIHQCIYRSHPSLKLSDHKPVSAVFDTKIKVINRIKYRRVYEDIMKQLDRWENEFLPQVQLDITDVQFDDVNFIEPQFRTITVQNVGQVPVEFEFINKLNEPSYCKPWLMVRPSKHIIDIKESCEIVVEVYVDKLTAPLLNTGADRLEDILVLHLAGGKDLFISVTGNYVPSSFGSSFEALVNMFCPIREMSSAKLLQLEKNATENTLSPSPDRPLDVPKELWRLVNHIYQKGMQTEDLFQMPGLHREIQQIRDALDTGAPENLPGTIHSVAEALLVFLESAREPVIPTSYHARCLDCCSNYTLCKQVLAQIPQSHRNIFKYMCAFIRKLLTYTANNNLDVKHMATLFGGLFLRAPAYHDVPVKAQQQQEERKKAAFVYHFLTNDYDE